VNRSLARLLSDRLALICFGVIALYAFVALLVALGVIAEDFDARVGAKFLGPGADHWLGTDRQGRDIFTRTLYSAKIAIGVGLVSAVISVLVGTLLGSLAGWFKGATDAVIVWLYSTVQSVPSILLLIGLTYVAGRGLFGVYVAFCATFWVAPCRVVRAEVLKLRESEYVQAARALGYSPWRILFAHVVPNTVHLMLVNFALLFVGAIKSEVILSYLGLGVQGEPSWGVMINQARGELINGFFWQIGAATCAMFLLVLAFNVFADALQDALDPKNL
jgi:ABC-type dipeptide/oligopeptide/nickel transport system permease subunit